jgi:PhnB protein
MATPYLFFNGKCDEALEFYRKALGAEIRMKMRFKDSQGFSLTYNAKDEADAKRRFEALATDGGTVEMPFGETFFAKAFGGVQDRFGVSWMVIAGAKNP